MLRLRCRFALLLPAHAARYIRGGSYRRASSVSSSGSAVDDARLGFQDGESWSVSADDALAAWTELAELIGIELMD